MKILAASVIVRPYNQGQRDIIVTLDKRNGREDMRYEMRSGTDTNVYRAQSGDFGSFFAWKGPDNEGGFGGSQYSITMLDGAKVTLLGPWSSRAGAINRIFHDRDPLVDCVGSDNVTLVCTKAALERFGIKFFDPDPKKFDVQYKPKIKGE